MTRSHDRSRASLLREPGAARAGPVGQAALISGQATTAASTTNKER